MSFDILKSTIAMPSCSPALAELIKSVLIREQHLVKNNRFRMSEVAQIAQERTYVEKICLKSFPNCVSCY